MAGASACRRVVRAKYFTPYIAVNSLALNTPCQDEGMSSKGLEVIGS